MPEPPTSKKLKKRSGTMLRVTFARRSDKVDRVTEVEFAVAGLTGPESVRQLDDLQIGARAVTRMSNRILKPSFDSAGAI